MRVLYYDCFAGISGDMHLAALVDLGLPPEYLRLELAKLKLPGWTLRFTPDSKNGIGGTRADVDLNDLSTDHDQLSGESENANTTTSGKPKFRRLGGGHSHTGHEHSHPHDHLGLIAHHHVHGMDGHAHSHRNYRDIIELINASALSEPIKSLSLAIFERVAKAESKVHGVSLDEVGFHEVGAVDSIIDIVGGAIGIDWFKPDLIIASPPELGGGTVRCANGGRTLRNDHAHWSRHTGGGRWSV